MNEGDFVADDFLRFVAKKEAGDECWEENALQNGLGEVLKGQHAKLVENRWLFTLVDPQLVLLVSHHEITDSQDRLVANRFGNHRSQKTCDHLSKILASLNDRFYHLIGLEVVLG